MEMRTYKKNKKGTKGQKVKKDQKEGKRRGNEERGHTRGKNIVKNNGYH